MPLKGSIHGALPSEQLYNMGKNNLVIFFYFRRFYEKIKTSFGLKFTVPPTRNRVLLADTKNHL